MAFIEGFHRRQVIVSIHVTSSTQKVESQNMDGIEDGTHDAIISIPQTFCMNLKVSNDNDFSILHESDFSIVLARL